MNIKSKFPAVLSDLDLNLVCAGGAGTGEAAYEGFLSVPAKVARGIAPDADARVGVPQPQALTIACSEEFVAMPMMTNTETGARICDSYVRASEIMMIWERDGEACVCLNDPSIFFATTLAMDELIAKIKTKFNAQYIPVMKQNVFISEKYPELAEVLKQTAGMGVIDVHGYIH